MVGRLYYLVLSNIGNTGTEKVNPQRGICEHLQVMLLQILSLGYLSLGGVPQVQLIHFGLKFFHTMPAIIVTSQNSVGQISPRAVSPS